MSGLRNAIKQNESIYKLALTIYSAPSKLKAIPVYLVSDKIHFQGRKTGENQYLLLKFDGCSGLMTQMVVVLGWTKFSRDNDLTLIVDMTSGRNMYRDPDDVSENVWEKFYYQPMVGYPVGEGEIKSIVEKDRYAYAPSSLRFNYRFEPQYNLARKFAKPKITFPAPRDFKERPELQKEFQEIYKEHIRFKPEVQKYLDGECQLILEGKGRVLGVLVRGTDYVQSRPYMHPVQPSTDEVINKCIELSGKWDYIYLATEEKKTEDFFQGLFRRQSACKQEDVLRRRLQQKMAIRGQER